MDQLYTLSFTVENDILEGFNAILNVTKCPGGYGLTSDTVNQNNY